MTPLERFNEMREKGSEIYFDAEEIIELLEHFDDTDDRDGFTRALEIGLKLHPEDPEIRIMECRLSIYDEKYDEALQLITRLRNSGEDDMELDIMELESLYATDRADEADALLQKMTNNEVTEEIYESLASSLAEMGKDEVASHIATHGLELYPDNIALKEECCYHAERDGRWDEAATQCEELIDLDPYSGDYWFMHGRLMAKLGDYDRAIHSLEFALTCNADDIEAKLLRAYLLFVNHNMEKAVEAYVELVTDEHFINEQLRSFTEKYDLSPDDLERASQDFHRLFGSVANMFVALSDNRADLENMASTLDRKYINKIEYLIGKLILEARAIRKSGGEWNANLLEDLRFLRFGELDHPDEGAPPSEHLSDEILRNKFHQN